jgi:hypothetical protein
MTQQDTGKFRTNTKDQFYTSPTTAAACVTQLLTTIPDAPSRYHWIEPSAGAGAFIAAPGVPATVTAIDIDPRAPSVIQSDFLQWQPPPNNKPILIYGNPPFGRQSAQAKAFIRHAATFATVIAFILPRSFEKPSMSAAFPPIFHCLHSAPIPDNAFTVNGAPYDVPCVFQIWQRQAIMRPVVPRTEPVGFTYVKATEPHHIVFRRVGVYAGRTALPAAQSPQSHYFWRLDDAHIPHIAKIITAINAHTFPTNTVGPRSISKPEANSVVNDILTSCAIIEH